MTMPSGRRGQIKRVDGPLLRDAIFALIGTERR